MGPADAKTTMRTGKRSIFSRIFFRWTIKKFVVTLLIVAVLVFGGNAVLQGGLQLNTTKPESVTTVTPTRQDIEDVLSLRAVLEGNESVEVSSGLHAEVLSIHVQEGDRVQKDQLLATLDATTLTQSIEREESDLALRRLLLQDTLRSRQREYDKALATMDAAMTYYGQIRALYEAGGETLLNLREAETVLADSRRAVNAYNLSNGKVVASASERQEISNAEQALEISRQKLDDTEIRSQIDGTVTRIHTRVGRFANETANNQPMFVIEDIDNLQMRVLVSEQSIAKVRIGQVVQITADILNGEMVAGIVERISPTGELREGSMSERVIPVYIRVTGRHERLISGITARAVIKIAFVENALVLPWETILEGENGSAEIYTVNEDNTISIVPVTLGIENDLVVEIRGDGVNEGTPVVVNPGAHLKEGMSVEVTQNGEAQ